MKKLSVFLLLTLVFLIMVNMSVAADTIRIGHVVNESHPYHSGAELFKDIVETQTNGRIKVQINSNGQLGNEKEMLEMAKLGTIEGVLAGRYAGTNPKLEGLGLPFLFRDYEHAEKVLYSDIGEQFAQNAENYDLKIIGFMHSGFRQFTNNVRPIETPEDLEGLKLRVAPIDVIVKTINALGGDPTPMAFSELYMALRTGVVDGQENPYTNIYSAAFYEVQDYLSTGNYIYIVNPFWVSLDWYNSLSEEDQNIIDMAGKAACRLTNELTKIRDQQNKAQLIEEGMEHNVISQEDKELFIEKTKSVYDWAIEEGYITQEIIDQIKEM